MSRAAKQSIIILIVLILAAMGFPSLHCWKKKKLSKKKIALEHQIENTVPEKTNLLENKIFKKSWPQSKKKDGSRREVEQFRREH